MVTQIIPDRQDDELPSRYWLTNMAWFDAQEPKKPNAPEWLSVKDGRYELHLGDKVYTGSYMVPAFAIMAWGYNGSFVPQGFFRTEAEAAKAASKLEWKDVYIQEVLTKKTKV